MMDAKSTNPISLYKFFHILHVCVSIGLIIAVVRNQLVNEAKFEKLENNVKLRTQAERTTRESKEPWTAKSLKESTTNGTHIVKRSTNNTNKKNGTTVDTRNQNTSKQKLNFKNSTFHQMQRIFKNKYADLIACLDLLEDFLRVSI
jgi:hypothetical protein